MNIGIRRPWLVGVAMLLVGAAGLAVPSSGTAHTGTHHSLWEDRWYQTLALGGGPFMTLSTFTSYNCVGACQTNWTAVKSATLWNWDNNAPTTVAFPETATLAESNNVRSTVIQNGYCPLHFGLTFCLPSGVLGGTWNLVHGSLGSHSSCTSACYPPGLQTSIQHAVVVLNDSAHSGLLYGTQFQRQATMVHEFGHVQSLAHDYLGDGLCGSGTSPLATAMDYDCLDLGITNGPTSFDFCGVNHAYYDPNWGFSGC